MFEFKSVKNGECEECLEECELMVLQDGKKKVCVCDCCAFDVLEDPSHYLEVMDEARLQRLLQER